MKKKKPDNVAWDEKEERYNQSILPYGTNISAPVIVLDDVAGFKSRGVNKVQKTFNSKFQEIKDDYEKLIDEVKLNEMIYSSNFAFEPVIGEIYHLYERKNGNYFLSLIAPNEWGMKHITSVRLNSEHKWVFTEGTSQKRQ
jgi:hypothetical protein